MKKQLSAQTAADKINEAGGSNGKQVVLKSFDSKNDAKEAAEGARLICQDKTILATIGDFSSTCCMATAPIYEENKTVQISPSAGLIDLHPYCPHILCMLHRNTSQDMYWTFSPVPADPSE